MDLLFTTLTPGTVLDWTGLDWTGWIDGWMDGWMDGCTISPSLLLACLRGKGGGLGKKNEYTVTVSSKDNIRGEVRWKVTVSGWLVGRLDWTELDWTVLRIVYGWWIVYDSAYLLGTAGLRYLGT